MIVLIVFSNRDSMAILVLLIILVQKPIKSRVIFPRILISVFLD